MKKWNILVFAFAITLSSCGGNETEKKVEPAIKAAGQSTDKVEEPKVDIPEVLEISIEGNDQMKYNLEKIEAYEGQTVKLTLKHVGEMPREAMGHNWVLLQSGVDVAEFAAAAVSAADNDYIPADKSADIITHTKTLGGGEETSIEFEAPAKGSYDFICSFPGHYGMMKGKFIVK